MVDELRSVLGRMRPRSDYASAGELANVLTIAPLAEGSGTGDPGAGGLLDESSSRLHTRSVSALALDVCE